MRTCMNCTHIEWEDGEYGPEPDCGLYLQLSDLGQLRDLPQDRFVTEYSDHFRHGVATVHHDEIFAKTCRYYDPAGVPEKCHECGEPVTVVSLSDDLNPVRIKCTGCGADDEVYRSLPELLAGFGLGVDYEFGRALYKATPCGPWTTYILKQVHPWASAFNPREVYYEDVDPRDHRLYRLLLSTCYAVKVGSIVEGSDVEIGPVTLRFPFTGSELDRVAKRIDDEASFYWERDNSTYFSLKKDGHWTYFQWVGFACRPNNYEEFPFSVDDRYAMEVFWNVLDELSEGEEGFLFNGYWVRREEVPDITY